MSFKEVITAKITTAEAWEVIAKVHWREVNETKRWISSHMPAWTNADIWWVQREAARMYTEYYTETDELKRLNTRFGIFAHVSLKDPALVAYTPDAASGERDAQQAVSPGRLMTRYYAVSTQDYVRSEVENHNATACAVVEFIEGPAIAEAYNSMINTGLSSCMTKSTFKDGENPALAYDAPGIKLAVLRDTSGTINARSLVYETGDRKVYIRGYGNPSLIKKLKALGYTAGNFAGAKFKAIQSSKDTPDDPECKNFVFPYLDANGAMSARVGSSIVWMEDYIYAPKDTQLAMLSNYVGMPSSGGLIRLRKVPETHYKVKCELTGEELNRLSDQRSMLPFWNSEQQQKGWALESAISAFRDDNDDVVEAKFLAKNVFAKKSDTITVNGRYYVNSEANLESYGLVKLDEDLYPGGGYYLNSMLIKIDDKYYKAEDTVKIFSKDGFVYRKLSDLADKTVRKEYVKLHGGTLATKDCGYHITDTGRKVHFEIHELGYDYLTGQVKFKRGHVRKQVLSSTYLAPLGTDGYRMSLTMRNSEFFYHNVFKDIAADHPATASTLDWGAIKTLVSVYTNSRIEHVVSISSDMKSKLDWSYFGEFLQPPVEYVSRLGAALAASTTPTTSVIGKRILRELAEAEAIEYPNQLVAIPGTETVEATPAAAEQAEAVLPTPEIEVI